MLVVGPLDRAASNASTQNNHERELVREFICGLLGWSNETRVLFVRFLRTWYRAPNLILSLIIQYIFAGLFLGKSFSRV